MIKFKQGFVTNPNSGVSKDIVVKSAAPNTLKDAFIGGGIVMIGIAYLTVTAFRNGSDKFEKAEFKALTDADLLGEWPESLN